MDEKEIIDEIELFEKPLLDKLQSAPFTVAMDTHYVITRVAPGQYLIKIKLPELGEQQFRLTLVDGQFRLTGFLSLIGDNASYPLSFVADIVNSFVAKWVQEVLDANANKKKGTTE